MSKTIILLFKSLNIVPSLLFFLFIIFINGCKKDKMYASAEKNNSEISFVENAKRYFDSSLLEFNEIKYPNKKGTTRSLSELKDHIRWDKPILYKNENSNFLVVSLNEDLKPFENKSFEFFRNLIFQTDDIGSVNNMSIIEVLSDKDYSLVSNMQKITFTAIKYKYYSIKEIADSVNASIIFYNQNYRRDTSYQLRNGNIIPLRISFIKDLKITH